MYIDATFAPGKTGTFSFEYGGHTYTVLNQTVSESSVALRSDPITVTGNSGDTVVVTMTAGDLENLAEGTAYNLRITDRHLNNDLTLDSEVREVTFPIEGKTGDEAWQYTFKDLPVEEGVWNSAGNYANMTIYSYYLEEDPSGTTGGYVPEIKDSAGNVISGSNRIYNDDSITVTNKIKSKVTLNIVKVDATNMTTPLKQGQFMLKELDPEGKGSYLTGQNAVEILSVETNGEGKTTIPDIPDGYYEISETKLPAGYIQTDDGKFYIQAINGVIKILTKDAEKVVTEWEERTLSQQDKLEFDASTITVTVGNTPGAALPSTGGPGTRLFTILGSIMILGAGMLLLRKRKMI
jgi:LPXTG-motif cell wall-anchored protein